MRRAALPIGDGGDVVLGHRRTLAAHRAVLLPAAVEFCLRPSAPSPVLLFACAVPPPAAIVPCIIIAIAIFTGFSLAHMYGIACAALGMLGTISTCE